METGAVVERVERVAGVRALLGAGCDEIRDALRATSQVRSWLDAVEADLTRALSAQVSFPEKDLAECTRGSTRDAIKTKERCDTLDAVPSLAGALDEARVTAGHVDEFTKATKNLDNDQQRDELRGRLDSGLLDVAAVATVEEWRRRLAVEVKNIQADDGIDRLERQRRATRVRTWTDNEGMWCVSGRFDPVTGVKLSAKLDATVQALFAEATPDTCPTDPVDKQCHLAGLALAELIDGNVSGSRSGRPEFIVVVDTSTSDGAGGPSVDWGIPVEIPARVMADMMNEAAVHAIVVRNGVILHAPGQLDLGRSTRLASPAQRRALRALYATCAIPGCSVRYGRCKIHHVIWWRNGGRTDLQNLLPVCPHHHTQIHDGGWGITLGPNRELTTRFPDGTIHNTGPPKRAAA